MPLFSVVIPVHNKGRLLLDSLNSVQSQTFRDFEVVVVDDASTDDCIQSVEHFLCLPLRLLHRPIPGPGGYAARNFGIREALGEWIAFLDADDLWLPQHLAVAAAAIEDHPEAAILCTGFQEHLGGRVETIAVPSTVCLSSAVMMRLYAHRDLFHTNSMVVRRDALLAAGGFPEQGVRRGGDHSLWLRLILLGFPVVLEASVTSRYRRDHSGVVSDPTVMQGFHPVVSVVERALADQIALPPDWGGGERRALKVLANRRSLLWLLQRRLAGLPLSGHRRLPYPFALTYLDSLRWLIAVVCPTWLVEVLHDLRCMLRVRLPRWNAEMCPTRSNRD